MQVIVTKWDRAAGESNEFIEEKLNWLTDRHGARLATLTTHKVALRSKAAIKAGFGMEELLKKWVVIQSRFSPPPAAKNNSYFSEFDRLDSTWPIAMGQEIHE